MPEAGSHPRGQPPQRFILRFCPRRSPSSMAPQVSYSSQLSRRFRMASSPTRRVGWTLLGLLASSACGGPQIRSFSITPRVVCEGERAVLHWDAEGALAITMEIEPEAHDPDCPAVGRDTVALTLVASKGSEELNRKMEMVQLHGQSAEPVVIQTNAMEGGQVIARGEKNVTVWGNRVEVAAVAACGHRSLTVEHSGRTASLGAEGASSDALSGTALSGPWELRSPLTPKEQAEPSLRPNALKLLATLRCRQEKP